VLAVLEVVVGGHSEIEGMAAGPGWKTWAEFWAECGSAAWRICCCWMLISMRSKRLHE